MKDYQILKVNDHTDSYYTKKADIFDLPARILIVGKSFLSGKSTIILNQIKNILSDEKQDDHVG